MGKAASGITGGLTDPKHVFISAADAEHSCAVLQGEMNRRAKATPDGGSARFQSRVPLAVMTALTVELYLKCLLRIENGGWPREHKHRLLFNALGSHRQKEIREWHNAFIATDPTQLQLQALENATFQRLAFEFHEQLDLGSDVFVEWRYWFEEPTRMNEGFVGYPSVVARAVRAAILKIKPEWERYITDLRD